MISRWTNAFKNSFAAIRYGFLRETALKEEMIALFFSFPVTILISDSLIQFIVLISSIIFLITIEALNTAIESTCDKITLDQDKLIGVAKDYGSLAVFGALLMVALIWIWSILHYLAII